MKTKPSILRHVFFLCLTVTSIFVYGQHNVQVQQIPLVIKLAAVCNKITSEKNDPTLLMKAFFGDSIVSYKNKDTINNFISDSSVAFLKINPPILLDRFFDSSKKTPVQFKIFLNPISSYVIKDNGRVIFDSLNSIENISYPELKMYFGKVFSDYPIEMQPKDTEHFHIIYTNPQTQHRAIIKITSFNLPDSKYNIIRSILISTEQVSPPFHYSVPKPVKPVTQTKNKKNNSKPRYAEMMRILCKTITNKAVNFDSIKKRLVIPFQLCNEQTEQDWDSINDQWVNVPLRKPCGYEQVYFTEGNTLAFIIESIDSSFFCKQFFILPSVTFYKKKKSKTAIEVAFAEMENEYGTTSSNAEPSLPDDICFADLVKIFGKPIKSVKDFGQYNTVFNYKNPVTKKNAELTVQSSKPANSKQNIIHSLIITSFQNK